MSSQLPGDREKRELQDPFSGFFQSMNEFFHAGPFKGLLEQMDEFFKAPFPSFYVDIREEVNEHIITAELPGIKKEQITIDVLDHLLTITVNHEEIITEENQQRELFRKRESHGQMVRRIYLGHPINERKIRATFQNGLLKIRVPKIRGSRIDIHEL